MSYYRNKHRHQHGGFGTALSVLPSAVAPNITYAPQDTTPFTSVQTWAAANIPGDTFAKWPSTTSVALDLSPSISSVLGQISTSLVDPNVINSSAPSTLPGMSDMMVQSL